MFELFGGLLSGLGSIGSSAASGLGSLFSGGLLSGGGLSPLSGTPANVPLPPMRPPELGASLKTPADASSLFGNFGKMNDEQKRMLQVGNSLMQKPQQQERPRLGAWQSAPIQPGQIMPFSTLRRR